jgi:hypothetical protein
MRVEDQIGGCIGWYDETGLDGPVEPGSWEPSIAAAGRFGTIGLVQSNGNRAKTEECRSMFFQILISQFQPFGSTFGMENAVIRQSDYTQRSLT